MGFTLKTLPGTFAVCRLPPTAAIPIWAFSGAFCSVSRTTDEVSIVCDDSVVPPEVRHQAGWGCLKLEGPFEFTLTGVLASVLIPLRDAGIGIFAVSTFDTDYVLVPSERLSDAISALSSAGHAVVV